MIAWHYTPGQKYNLIKESGLLLPADLGVVPPELPILWFSTHPTYEPSAMKPLGDSAGNLVRMLTLKEMHEMAEGLVRFGCPISRLKCGENLRKAAKMPSIWWRRLSKRAVAMKANPSDWWGHVGTMRVDELTVEIMDDNMAWRPAPAGLRKPS